MSKQLQMVTDQLVRLSTEYAEKLGIELPIKFTAEVEHDIDFGFMVHLSYTTDMSTDVFTALHFVLDRDEYEITLEEWCKEVSDDVVVLDPNEIGPLVDQATELVPLHKEAQGWINLLFYLCGTQENDILWDYNFRDGGYYVITVTNDGVSVDDGRIST